MHFVAPIGLAENVKRQVSRPKAGLEEHGREGRAERDELKALNDEFYFLVVRRRVAIDEP